MNISRRDAGQDWKQFLGLGEDLLKQPHAAAQCDLIAHTLKSVLGCDAQVWLAEPHYPLPGEPEVSILPGAPAPELVRQVFNSRRVAYAGKPGRSAPKNSDYPRSRPPSEVAFPILAQDYLLGVVYARREASTPFCQSEWSFFEALTAHAGVAMQSTRQTVLKNWRHEQLALVRSVSAQVANVTDLDDLCKRVTRLILDTFKYYHAAIFTLDASARASLDASARASLDASAEAPRDANPEALADAGVEIPSNADEEAGCQVCGEALVFRASANRDAIADAQSYTVRVGEGMIGTVAKTGEEQIAEDVQEHPHYRFLPNLAQTRSEIALPLKIDRRILGVLDVQSERRDAFHESDILVLRALADAIALAVEGARLYTSVARRADQNAAVFEVTHVLTSILDFDQLLDEVVRVIQKRFGYQYVHIFSVHPGRRKVFYLAGSGSRSERMRAMDLVFHYDLDDPTGVIPYAARSGKTYRVNDVDHDPIYRHSELPPDDTRAELAIPLIFGSEVLGVLDLQSDRSQAFTPEDVALLESVAASIAIAYHNATLYRSEQWRRQVGDSFRDVASLLSANVGLERLFDTILAELERNLPCDASALWLADDPPDGAVDAERPLRLAAVHGANRDEIVRALEGSGAVRDWLSGVLELDTPIVRRMGDPYGPLGAALQFSEDYSSIAAPLRTGRQSLGVLTLAHHTANRYGTEACTIITTFASYAAVAIQNARLYSEAQTQAWLSTILLQVAEASQSVNSIDELLSSMVRLTRLLVGIKKCAMFLWDETQQSFALNAWYGLESRPAQTLFREEDVPALARLVAERTPVFIQDAAVELNLPAAALPKETGTLVILPLLARDTLLGAFLVAHQASHQAGAPALLDRQTLSILQGIAHQTAVALENLNLLDAQQEEAYVTAVLLQVAQAVVSQNKLQDILDTIVHLMPILIGIDASIVYLWDPLRKTFYAAQAYAGSRELEMDLTGCTYKSGVFKLLDQVRQANAVYYCKAAHELAAPAAWLALQPLPIEFMRADGLAEGEDWLLGFPLAVKGELLGVLLAKEAGVQAPFQERRLEIITGIAQQAALSIQNERLKQEMVARERLEQEMQVAREIQTTFLPNRLPNWTGWQIAARWQTARQVGGDFYDIYHQGRDRLGLAIADVSDKGLPAALYMTVARTLIRAFSKNARSAASVLERVNGPLVTDTPHSMFVTAVYAMLWPDSGRLLYANAGHNRPLLLRAKEDRIETLPKGGLALGVMAQTVLEEYEALLEPGDCLVLYTDGVTECLSPSNETYGEERLYETLKTCLGLEVEEILDRIEDSLADFRASAPTSDDMTLLAIRRLPDGASQ